MRYCKYIVGVVVTCTFSAETPMSFVTVLNNMQWCPSNFYATIYVHVKDLTFDQF